MVFSFSVARRPGSPTTGSTLEIGPDFLASLYFVKPSVSCEVAVSSLGLFVDSFFSS